MLRVAKHRLPMLWKHRCFTISNLHLSSPLCASFRHLASPFFTDTYAEAVSLFYWHLRWLTFCWHLRSHLPSPFFSDTYAEAISLLYWHLRLPTLTFSYVFVLKKTQLLAEQNVNDKQSVKRKHLLVGRVNF